MSVRWRRRLTSRRIAIPPQPRRDVAVAAETLRPLPDDEGVLDRVRHQVAIVASPGKPDREPPGVAFIQRAEGAHIASGDASQQRLVAQGTLHTSTVVSRGRKRFTRPENFPGRVRGSADGLHEHARGIPTTGGSHPMTIEISSWRTRVNQNPGADGNHIRHARQRQGRRRWQCCDQHDAERGDEGHPGDSPADMVGGGVIDHAVTDASGRRFGGAGAGP